MYYGSSGVSADKSIFIAMAIIILCLGLVSTAFGNKTELMPDDLIALYEAPIAPGSETRSGDLVEVGQTESIPGDLIVACKTLKMNGKVNGDLLVGGLHLSAGSIANVARDLTMGGYNLRMEGAVGEDARMAGAHVEISGTVDGDLVVFGGNVRISGDVMGDVIAGGGKVNVSGNIQGDLEAGCGEMVIGGVIGQNVVLTASRLVLASTAELKGNLTYTSKRAVEIEEGAQVTGDIKMEPGGRTMILWKLAGMVADRLPEQPGEWKEWKAQFPAWFRTLLRIASFVSLLIAGIIILSFYSRHATIVADRIVAFPLKCLLRGLIVLVCVPIGALILCVTIIGLPIGFVVLAAYLVFSYISRVYVALAIGREILDRVTKQEVRIIWPMILGLFIITVLSAIPYYVGWTVKLICILFGLGGMMMAGRRIRIAPREETT